MGAMSFSWPELDAIGSIVGGVGTALATAVALTLAVREFRGRRSRTTSAPSVDRGPAEVANSPELSPKPELSTPSPEQALRVYARILNVRRFDSGKRIDGIEFGVTNDSDAPVFDIVARVPGGSIRLRALSIESGETRSTRMQEVDVLDNFDMFGNGNPDDARVGVSFVDKNGVRWSRLGHGTPVVESDSVPKEGLFPGTSTRWGRGRKRSA